MVFVGFQGERHKAPLCSFFNSVCSHSLKMSWDQGQVALPQENIQIWTKFQVLCWTSVLMQKDLHQHSIVTARHALCALWFTNHALNTGLGWLHSKLWNTWIYLCHSFPFVMKRCSFITTFSNIEMLHWNLDFQVDINWTGLFFVWGQKGRTHFLNLHHQGLPWSLGPEPQLTLCKFQGFCGERWVH